MTNTQYMIIEELKRKLRESDRKYRKLVIDSQNEKIESQNKDRMIEDYKNRVDELESYWDPKVLERGGSSPFMHAQNNLERIINDDRQLGRTISTSKERFDDICRRVAEVSHGDDRMFHEDGSPLPGNRCRLSRDQTVYMSILLKKADPRQVDLEMLFGIHQSTVSRAVEYIDGILADVLPTAHIVQQEIRAAGQSKLEQFVPDSELFTDGTENQIERPQDNEVQKEYYSGKKKRHTVKCTVIINKDGLIIFIGVPHKGRTHDMKMLRLDDPDFGILTKRMKSGRTSDANKPPSWTDSGYVSIENLYPGIMVLQPIKRPRKKKGEERKDLSRAEKKYNRDISSVRIKVEHAIGKLKQYSVLRNVYVRSDDYFYRDIQIISGLVNHRILWNAEEKRLNLGL